MDTICEWSRSHVRMLWDSGLRHMPGAHMRKPACTRPAGHARLLNPIQHLFCLSCVSPCWYAVARSKHFAPSWVEGVKRAGITYWYIAAMDPWASAALGALGVTQCFNAPIEVPSAEGAHRHTQTTHAHARTHKQAHRRTHTQTHTHTRARAKEYHGYH